MGLPGDRWDKGGHRHHQLGRQVHAVDPAVRLAVRPAMHPEVHRQQRRGHVRRRDGQHHHPGRARVPERADTEEIEAQAKAAGGAIPQVISQVQQVFLNYFNSVYNLYGRKVVIEPYTTQASFTTEELGQGQPQACADADTIANQMHAFGETGMTNGDSYGGTGPFSTCAAQDHLVEFDGDPYFDEAAFESLNPYVWSITQNCNTITDSEAEVVATMLGGRRPFTPVTRP